MRRAIALSPLSSLLRHHRHRLSFGTTPTTPSDPLSILAGAELAKVNKLIGRLCDSNNLQEAIRLLTTSVRAAPPPSSLTSLPLLVDRIASLPGHDISTAMSLLNVLRRRRSFPLLPLCANLLVSSYLRHRRLQEAILVFTWLLREDIPGRPDEATYRAMVAGLCARSKEERGVVLLRVLREMVRDGVAVDEEVRGWVWDYLLTEARVDQAKEIDQAFASNATDIGELIDRLIKEWED